MLVVPEAGIGVTGESTLSHSVPDGIDLEIRGPVRQVAVDGDSFRGHGEAAVVRLRGPGDQGQRDEEQEETSPHDVMWPDARGRS